MASWWATLVIGVAVLFFGRRLFWLFVGAAGPTLGLTDTWLWGVAFAVGILLAALVLWLWDPVLIVLSAVTGAALLAPLLPVSSALRPWLFIGLLIVGIVVQARMLTPPAREEARSRRKG
jgi:hypothetical protein